MISLYNTRIDLPSDIVVETHVYLPLEKKGMKRQIMYTSKSEVNVNLVKRLIARISGLSTNVG